MTHTPGPWKHNIPARFNPTVYTPKGKNCKTPNDANGGKIAEVYGWGNADHDQQDANARLIAAAPDLLEALEAVTNYMADDEPENDPTENRLFQKARAAIRKARES